jgi:hypothetical protein
MREGTLSRLERCTGGSASTVHRKQQRRPKAFKGDEEEEENADE